MSTVTIDLARDFSRTPGGRYERDGVCSAEAFRREHLDPAVARGGAVTVDLDGALGFGSSFLEEAFGGLVRAHGRGVAARVTIVSAEHPGSAEKARVFMDEAAARLDGDPIADAARLALARIAATGPAAPVGVDLDALARWDQHAYDPAATVAGRAGCYPAHLFEGATDGRCARCLRTRVECETPR